MNEIICAACGLPITGEDYEDRVWGHEPDCLANTDPEAWQECGCDLEYHWDCAPEEECTEEPWPDLRGKVIAA